jgi:hypothetical protein
VLAIDEEPIYSRLNNVQRTPFTFNLLAERVGRDGMADYGSVAGAGGLRRLCGHGCARHSRKSSHGTIRHPKQTLFRTSLFQAITIDAAFAGADGADKQ